MQLSQLVTSLETSKKLKELGVKQESLFYWHETARLDNVHVLNQQKSNDRFCHSAFTSSELGEMMKEENLSFCRLPMLAFWNTNLST